MEFLIDNYIWIIIVAVILMTIIGYIAEKTNFGKKEFSKRKSGKNEGKKNDSKEEVKSVINVETPIVEETKPEVEMKKVEVEAPSAIAPQMEQSNEEFDAEAGMSDMSSMAFEPTSTEDFSAFATNDSEETSFNNSLTDDMVATSDVIDSTESYHEPVSSVDLNDGFAGTEELSVPFGDAVVEEPVTEGSNASPGDMEDVASYENLNAPFGDMEATTFHEDVNNPSGDMEAVTFHENLNNSFSDMGAEVSNEDLNVPLTDTSSMTAMMEEDLDVPFGDNGVSSDSYNLELPDIDSIKEDVSVNIDNDTDDDDIWKF